MASPMEVGDETEWELSKENVQPLRQGRKFSNLTAALQPHTANQMARIREERQQLEAELRTYSGDDPLEVWDRYIKWTEQNFPKGGKESNLLQILERCVTVFKDEEAYRNDSRYIAAWIKFAGMCTDPLEIYSFLFSQKIGSKLAQFYEAWAWELERVGNTKKADIVYGQGLQNGAQPYQQLQKRHNELQVRVARRLAGEMVATPDHPGHTTSSEEPFQRGALGELKVKGKKGSVSSNRIGSARSHSSTGSISGASGSNISQQTGGIQIFCDENSTPVQSLPPQTGQWNSVPSRESKKENERAAGVWTHARAKQRGMPSVSVSEVGSVSKPSFEIHVDPDTPQPLVTKKPEKNPDRFYHVQHHVEEDPNQRPMYCKAKIYTGAEEFSFEELRAARWRERKRRADMKLWEDYSNQSQPMYCKLKIYGGPEELQFEELRTQAWNRRGPAPHTPMYSSSLASTCYSDVFEPTPVHPGKQVQEQIQERESYSSQQQLRTSDQNPIAQAQTAYVSAQPTSAAQSTSAVPRCTITDEAEKTRSLSLSNISHQQTPQQGSQDSTENTSQLFRQISSTLDGRESASRDSGSSSSVAQARASESFSRRQPSSGNSSLNASKKTNSVSFSFNNTADSSSRPGSNKHTPDVSMKSPARTPRLANSFMSPTVNTKAAMQVVFGMFSETLDPKKEFGWAGDEDSADDDLFAADKEEEEEEAPPPFKPVSGTGFTIYDDSKPTAASVPTAKGEDNAVIDKENCPPSRIPRPGKRQALGGILPCFNEDPPAEPEVQKAAITSFTYEVEMADEDDDDIAGHKAVAGRTMNLMENGLQEFDPGNLTFAPEFSSTGNFSKMAALLASTPMVAAPLTVPPPVSAIKAVDPQGPGGHLRGDITGDGIHARGDITGGEAIDSTVNEMVKRKSMLLNCQNLSPITENSEPSSASSLGSTNSTGPSHLTMNSTNHHHTTNGGSHIYDATANTTRHDATANSTRNDQSHAAHVPRLTNSEHEQRSGHAGKKALSDRTHDDSVVNKSCHEIDLSNYVSPDLDDQTARLFNMSIAIDPSDPFDEDLIARFLKKLPVPLEAAPNHYTMGYPMPPLKNTTEITIGTERYTDIEALGKGAFATVYRAKLKTNSGETDRVIKVQKPACPWEFYITNELLRRLGNLKSEYVVASSIMYVDYGYFFNDGSFLVSDLEPLGTLLDLVNSIKQSGRKIEEGMLIILLREMLLIVEHMHRCKIIHGDIKPDNFLLRALPKGPPDGEDVSAVLTPNTPCLKLIDFGRSIDMKMFPPGTTFTASVKTSCFECIEMKTGNPWTYQTDLFGLVGSVHVLAFGDYMKVYQEAGRWRVTASVKRRYQAVNLWQHFFDELLNIKSCDDLPDLATIREDFTQFLIDHPPTRLSNNSAYLELLMLSKK